MPRAKTLEEHQIAKAIAVIEEQCWFPHRDTLMLLLSFRCGLRAQEIAYLDFRDVTDAEGEVTNVLHVTKRAAKYGRERTLPLREDVRACLVAYIAREGIASGPLFKTQYGTEMTPNAVQRQLGEIYRKAGFRGVSSHSGRRTFITRTARRANEVGCSIKDVQELAGHANLATTECYIELSDRQVDLVSLI